MKDFTIRQCFDKNEWDNFVGFGLCNYELSESDIDLVIKSFHKVWSHLAELKNI